MNEISLRGVRFAPSPTGHFHIGNLRTAWVASRLAKTLDEPFVIRIEDIDTARIKEKAWTSQLSDLSALGLVARQTVTQTHFARRHAELFATARLEGRVYPCDCSRREVLTQLSMMRSAPHAAEPEYSGHCRNRIDDLSTYRPKETLAWRWKDESENGAYDSIVARSASDASGFMPGYHWACAVDDADGGYNVLVRAWDLAPADRVQRQIRKWVSKNGPEPIVFHTSLVINSDGTRLEKRTAGVTLAELSAEKISAKKLSEKFEASFKLDDALSAIESRVRPAGETERSILLPHLLAL